MTIVSEKENDRGIGGTIGGIFGGAGRGFLDGLYGDNPWLLLIPFAAGITLAILLFVF